MRLLSVIAVFFSLTFLAAAQSSASNGVLGEWREPRGSVIEIFPCNKDICAKVISVRREATSRFDINNPNPGARSHLLCGLQIGYGFHATGSASAEGGKLYDPKNGRTYSGSMYAKGDQLFLRGYILFRFFGRTETWKRVDRNAATCAM